ncbi:MAG: glycosyltransferase, partial [bacterium]
AGNLNNDPLKNYTLNQYFFNQSIMTNILNLINDIINVGSESLKLIMNYIYSLVQSVTNNITLSQSDINYFNLFLIDLENNVIFLKNINFELKNALLKNANIFLMPARIEGTSVEGFGISYIEAASYEVPSI